MSLMGGGGWHLNKKKSVVFSCIVDIFRFRSYFSFYAVQGTRIARAQNKFDIMYFDIILSQSSAARTRATCV
jgi:hypothetical protein